MDSTPRTIFSLSMLAAICAPATAQTWTQVVTPTSPTSHSDHAAAYDVTRAETVIFGRPGETWTYDGTTWTQQFPASSPSPRLGTAMDYDLVRGVSVLFGGNTVGAATRFNDTWEWDGTNWTQANPVTSPPARLRHAMAHDYIRGKTVVFGGITSPVTPFSDTWEWDGTNWTQVITANNPGGRELPYMTFDSNRGVCVLFGGWGGGGLGQYRTGTWEYDGIDWREVVTANEPLARQFHRMCFDPSTGYVVLWGGFNAGFLTDTWVYDSFDWTEVPSAAGVPVASNALVFDQLRGVCVSYGGQPSASNGTATWEFDPSIYASASPFGVGCMGSNGTPTLDAASGSAPILGANFSMTLQGLPLAATATNLILGFSRVGPLDLAPIGMDNGCLLEPSVDFAIPVGAAGGSASTTLGMPSDPFWLGRALWFQALTVDPTANTLGATLSNGLRASIGS